NIGGQIAEGRKDEREFRLKLPRARATHIVVETEADLRRTFRGRAVTESSEIRILNGRRLCRREERRVVLAEENEAGRLLCQLPVNARPSETQAGLARTNRRDIAIVHAREVALEIELKATSDNHLRSWIKPLEVCADAKAARSQVK